MNRSKTIALILGPSLVVIGLLIGYWLKLHQADADAPLELHANVEALQQSAVAPLAGLSGEDANREANETPIESGEKQAAIAPTLSASDPVSGALPVETSPNSSRIVPPPKFDVVRVEPSGDAVIAGHTEPNAQVAVVANGKVIAEGKTDGAGQFVLLPPPLASGEHELALRVMPPSGAAADSAQRVIVSVPQGKGDVMVALAEPGKATVLLADPTAKTEAESRAKAELPASTPADPKKLASKAKTELAPLKPDVAIKTAEIVEPGGFFVSGLAMAGARLRLYLNGSAFAEVTADPDGRWTVKVGKGLISGHYAVRADQIDKGGSVVARAEVPFDYTPSSNRKETLASATPSVQTPNKDSKSDVVMQPEIANPSAKAEASLSNAGKPIEAAKSAHPEEFVASNATAGTTLVAEIQTATVEKGNSLWLISRETLGRGMRYTEIYAANSTQIRDPKLIYPGQVFVIPNQTN